MNDSSSPSRPSSKRMRFPPAPISFFSITRSIKSRASSKSWATRTPLPAQAIRLDYHGPFDVLQRAVSLLCRFECAIHFCRWDAVPFQEFLAENLAALELRCLLRRSDDGPAALAERVTDAVHERQFRSDHSQVRKILFRKPNEACHVAGVNGHAFGISGNPAVSGSAPDFLHARTLLQLPHQRVLAPASANHQNFHP